MTLSLTLTLTLTLTRPKRNIRTAMNHEIMLYGIAQKVRGGAVTNRAQPHPDLRSPLALAALQEQLGFDKAVEECSTAPPLKPGFHSHALTRSSPRSQSIGCRATP